MFTASLPVRGNKSPGPLDGLRTANHAIFDDAIRSAASRHPIKPADRTVNSK
jgi:hypothetical protein